MQPSRSYFGPFATPCAALYAALCIALGAPATQARELSRQVFDCVMDPAETVKVASPVAGLLASVEVKRGDRVRRGQVLARLNSVMERATVELLATRASSNAAVAAQKARLELIRKRHARAKTLSRKRMVSQAAMEEVAAELVASESLLRRAKTEREIAAKELARAKAALRLRDIRSPIDGIVQSRRLTAGEYVTQERHVVSLVVLDPLHVEAFLPVRYFNQIGIGAPARVHPAEPVKGAFEAKVIAVDRVFDAASGTFGVLLRLPNPGGLMPAGHRCKLTFDLAEPGKKIN